jgi:probable DNA metabolism protein
MTYLYDGTFKGLLTVIFETYRLKTPASRIQPETEWQETLFEEPLVIATNPAYAARVKKGLAEKATLRAVKMLYRCLLSEQPDVEMLIYTFVRKAMASKLDWSGNFRDDTVLQLQRIDKKMGREIHRMHAFVRFQQTQDDIYYAVIEPDFNVLPLIIDHFEQRYPAQTWLIYDARRHYGMFYDQEKTEPITFAEQDHLQLRQLSPSILEQGETTYQQAWQTYFNSTNIPERRNLKLHLQHVPRRYWKYLTEK